MAQSSASPLDNCNNLLRCTPRLQGVHPNLQHASTCGFAILAISCPITVTKIHQQHLGSLAERTSAPSVVFPQGIAPLSSLATNQTSLGYSCAWLHFSLQTGDRHDLEQGSLAVPTALGELLCPRGFGTSSLQLLSIIIDCWRRLDAVKPNCLMMISA